MAWHAHNVNRLSARLCNTKYTERRPWQPLQQACYTDPTSTTILHTDNCGLLCEHIQFIHVIIPYIYIILSIIIMQNDGKRLGYRHYISQRSYYRYST